AGVRPDAVARHIRYVCLRRAPRTNPVRDSAIAPSLGAEAVYPPQYLRAQSEHWPGAALSRRRPTPETSDPDGAPRLLLLVPAKGRLKLTGQSPAIPKVLVQPPREQRH